VIAPVNPVKFSKKAGEVICRKKAETGTPTAGKYRLRALQCFETAAQSRDPYAKDMLTELAREFMQAALQVEVRREL
jgi:recombinational DNA repair protein (RecF pathway)